MECSQPITLSVTHAAKLLASIVWRGASRVGEPVFVWKARSKLERWRQCHSQVSTPLKRASRTHLAMGNASRKA
eukprot:2728548-Pyramimonas_sp.AAC.1